MNLITLEDGSLTCYDATLKEHYHNKVGALTEARQHYALPSQAVQRLREKVMLRILDVCFGLGYNTWATLLGLMESNCRGQIQVVALEQDTEILSLAPTILTQDDLVDLKPFSTLFEHNIYYQTLVGFEQIQPISLHGLDIQLLVVQNDLRCVVPMLEGPFDLVFHDAFAPSKVPQLWTIDMFEHYYRLLEPSGGRLLTYSAATAVRSGLKLAGFDVYKTSALGAKSGGTLAIVPGSYDSIDELPAEPLSNEELARMNTRASVPYRGLSLDETHQSVLRRRGLEQNAWKPCSS
jgi:tRNA U34 5-methylaminomethyl-2-thiouridine-forming methyltransferase MnmC